MIGVWCVVVAVCFGDGGVFSRPIASVSFSEWYVFSHDLEYCKSLQKKCL